MYYSLKKNNITTESIPKQLRGRNIEIVDVWELQKKFKKTKSLTLIRIVPLRVSEGEFFVDIIPFKVSRSKTGVKYVNSGGCKIEFLYDCASSTFILEKVESNGI